MFEMEDIDWQRLARYLAGECSPAEKHRLEAWIEADPTRRRLMKNLRSLWEASDQSEAASAPDDLDIDADWNQLRDKMRARERAVPPPSSPGDSRRHRDPRQRHRLRASTKRLIQTAALALLLIAGGWLAARLWLYTGSVSTVPSMREVVTERGERANIQLMDGTKVMLNVDSKLRLPKSFDDRSRAVHLEGEAYFDVVSDSTRPFIVHTKHAAVNVHGTTFDVRSYPDEYSAQVAVVEGRVSVLPSRKADTQAGTELSAGQLAQWTENDTEVTPKDVDVRPYLGWTEGRLVFNNTPLSDVAAQLERWYNLQFEIQSSALASLHLTANLKSQSIRDVLDVITASLNVQYQIDKNTVLLMRHPPSQDEQP